MACTIAGVPLVVQIGFLAVLAGLTQFFDLVTAAQMLMHHGPQFELNPVVRTMYVSLGPLGLGLVKLIALAMIVVLAGLGFKGQPRLIRNILVLTVVIGAVATKSNLV